MSFDMDFGEYEMINTYTSPIKKAERKMIGRVNEVDTILAAFLRPELCNVILLGEAGSGKTMLVQGVMTKDENRIYREINVPKLVSDKNQIASNLKLLFDESVAYCRNEKKELVLFIDEFHQLIQLSSAAVEALKPILADSGTRGIRIIAATTYIEFRKYISDNQPLVERLQRININEPDKKTVVDILKNMAKRYGVLERFNNSDRMFELIYEYTNRYIPANAQPRKSILVLDSMIGWHKKDNVPFDIKLLGDVIYQSEGINVAFRVNAAKIKQELDNNVLSQTFATSVIEQRLQICIADLNDKTKPMSSFLFTGSTGVGKTETAKQLARILFNDERRLIRFDMSEYANFDSLERFRTELTARVWERPYSIILLDEIEKACSQITKVLLQVLDDGRLSDINNREVSFQNSYIIMTTNAGSEIYKIIAQYSVDDIGSGRKIKEYDKAIRSSISMTTGDKSGVKFPPEFLGRIDTIVPFQPLSEKTQMVIVENRLKRLMREVKQKHNVNLKITKDVIEYIVKDNLDTDSDSGGARIIMHKLESELIAELARFINMYPLIKNVGVMVEGATAFNDKSRLKSEAYIKVCQYAEI